MKITMGPYTRCHSCLKPTFTFAEIWSRRFLYLNLHYHKNTQYDHYLGIFLYYIVVMKDKSSFLNNKFIFPFQIII